MITPLTKKALLYCVLLLIMSTNLSSQETEIRYDIEKLVYGVNLINVRGLYVEKRIVRNTSIQLELSQPSSSEFNNSTQQWEKGFQVNGNLAIKYYLNTSMRGRRNKRIQSNSADFIAFQIGRYYNRVTGKRFQKNTFSSFRDYFEPHYGLNRNLANLLKNKTNKHLQRINFSLKVGVSFPTVLDKSNSTRIIDQFQIPFSDWKITILLNKVTPYSKPSEHNASL